VSEPAAPALRGHLEVRQAVVDRVARLAALEVDGVLTGETGLLDLRHLPAVRTRVDGRRTTIAIDVAVAWGIPLAQVAAEVRGHVRERVRTLAGTEVAAVDVTIEHVVRPQDAQARRRVR